MTLTPAFTALRFPNIYLKLTSQGLFNGIDIKLVFKNNTADSAGSMFLGGIIDRCTLRIFGIL